MKLTYLNPDPLQAIGEKAKELDEYITARLGEIQTRSAADVNKERTSEAEHQRLQANLFK